MVYIKVSGVANALFYSMSLDLEQLIKVATKYFVMCFHFVASNLMTNNNKKHFTKFPYISFQNYYSFIG